MARDSQRSLVYRFERAFWLAQTGKRFVEEMTLEECREFVNQVWRRERGRYGHATEEPPPEVTWGRGCNATRRQIRLARFGRNKWVVLHELAHSMAKPGEGHGPRFVALLIGMAARNIAGLDGQAAVDAACELGVKVHVRSVGAIPVLREPMLPERILPHLPGRITQIAWRAGCRPSQVRGAALTLIRRGEARYYRRRLVPVEGHSQSRMELCQ